MLLAIKEGVKLFTSTVLFIIGGLLAACAVWIGAIPVLWLLTLWWDWWFR